MSTCQETRQNIKGLSTYIAKFPFPQQSAAVELLFSEAMSYMFHLRFFTVTTDDVNITQKVVWLGQDIRAPKNAPPFGPDTVVFARHFDILLETTQKTGARQWDGEFSRAVRHIEDYIRDTKMERDDVYLILLASEIYVDTYESIRQKIHEGVNIVPLRFGDLERILEVCDLAIGLRHFDLRQLFGTLIRDVRDTSSLSTFNRKATRTISEWRRTFLKHDQLAYVGIKSYNLFKSKKGTHLTASFIATEIYGLKEVKSYFKILKERPTKEHVMDSLLTFGFACETGIPQPDPILTIVSKLEIEHRINEILANIEKD